MVVTVRRDSAMAETMLRRSPPTRVMSEAAMATSAPVPMAMPRSAWASAPASLMPSPAMATTWPCSCSAATAAALSAGSTSDSTWVIPTWAATAFAVAALSPVIIHTSRPRASSWAIASADSGFTVSATVITAARSPSTATYIGVSPRDAASRATSRSGSTVVPARSIIASLPTCTCRPATWASSP